MPTFTYVARSRTGEKTEAQIQADDRRAAIGMLERMGLVPVSITEVKAQAEAAARKSFFRFERRRAPRLNSRDVLFFSTELSDLLAAGMTLSSALNILAARQTGTAADAVLPSLRDEILQGSSLSGALAKHPRSFSPLYIGLIRAGEASGALAEVLRRLVDHYEKIQEVREKVIMALVYPAIVLLVGAGTLLFSMLYVLPRFKKIFDEMEATLPPMTRGLMAMSKFLVNYGLILAALLVIAVVCFFRFIKTDAGRRWWHSLLLRMPLVRGILSSGIYATFSRTLATLLSNGVPVLNALGIVGQTVGNVVIADEIRNARDRVTDGTTISGPLAAGGVFPRMMTDMLAVGERTGNVAGALTHVARRYEQTLERNIKILTTALEPALIVVMAVMVGLVALSILSAVFSMTNGLDASAT